MDRGLTVCHLAPGSPFHLGTDDVLVVFVAEEASRVGLGA